MCEFMELEISSRWALAADLGSNPSLALTGRLVPSKPELLGWAMGTACLSHRATEQLLSPPPRPYPALHILRGASGRPSHITLGAAICSMRSEQRKGTDRQGMTYTFSKSHSVPEIKGGTTFFRGTELRL
jgi:hypothetical protein